MALYFLYHNIFNLNTKLCISLKKRKVFQHDNNVVSAFSAQPIYPRKMRIYNGNISATMNKSTSGVHLILLKCFYDCCLLLYLLALCLQLAQLKLIQRAEFTRKRHRAKVVDM